MVTFVCNSFKRRLPYKDRKTVLISRQYVNENSEILLKSAPEAKCNETTVKYVTVKYFQ